VSVTLEITLKPGVDRPRVGATFETTGETKSRGRVVHVHDRADGRTVLFVELTEAENIDAGFFYVGGGS
jgi:hypothetical protein